MSDILSGADMISPEDVIRESSRPTPGSLLKHHDLVSWLIQNGGFIHSDVVIAHQHGKGYHAVVNAGKSIAKDTRIASCPMGTTLCVLNALDIAPFSCRGTRFPQKFLDQYCHKPEILQTFFLMEQQLLGEKSWWSKYIATLPTPQDIEDLQFDSPEDRLWIQGTNLEAAIELQLQKWQEDYMEGLDCLEDCGWENAVNESLTW